MAQVSEFETRLYEEARERIIHRAVNDLNMITDHHTSYLDGLRFACQLDGPGDLQARKEYLMPRVKSESNDAFAIVCALMAKVEAVKGKGYQASWQRRGTQGVLANISRKFDRIDTIMRNGHDEGGESLTENLADLAVYCIKEICRRNEMNPAEVIAWAEGIRNLK